MALTGSLLLTGCKSTYKTLSFDETKIPEAPDYANEDFWAVLPDKHPLELKNVIGSKTEAKRADVFFIYPTILTDRKNTAWNADIRDPEIRKDVLEGTIAYQASAFEAAGNLYAPFYRQSHYKIYVAPYDKEEAPSRNVAYSDVRKAFQYYLDNYNNGKPIILASHSQGSIMGKMLLLDFFDNKPLQQRLVAAYLPGIRVMEIEFKTIKSLETPISTNGYVSWNTYKRKKYPKRYKEWYSGGTVTNPITWGNEIRSNYDQHLGVLNTDNQIYPNALEVEVIDGMLWSTVPKIPKRFFLSLIKNYHFADINLFWKDIQQNAIQRVDNWFKKNQPDVE